MLRPRLHNKRQKASLKSLSRKPFSRRATTSAQSPTPPPQSDRIQSILRRTPRFLRPTVSALHNAPVTHITAFLILHELTAIIPLFSLVGAFHYLQWLPPYFAEGKWVVAGVEKFGNYFRRKGWIDAGDEREAEKLAEGGEARMVEKTSKGKGRISRWWGRGETGTRLVVEFATAYAMVKVLLPLRLVISVWGAPWFARWTIMPLSNVVRGFFRRPKPSVTGSTAASLNATGTRAAAGKKITK
jgi:Hypothetical protein FLILHELTA